MKVKNEEILYSLMVVYSFNFSSMPREGINDITGHSLSLDLAILPVGVLAKNFSYESMQRPLQSCYSSCQKCDK